MAVTPEQVKQAQQAAADAQQRAAQAQQAADASRDAATQSRAAADSARTAANDAAKDAADKAADAAKQRADASAAGGVCQRGRDNAAAAQEAVQRAEENAKTVHAQYPATCNPETDGADAAVEAAESQVTAANSSRDTACAEADRKAAAAQQAEADAAKAKSDANDADRDADAAKTKAEHDAQKAQADLAAAQQAVLEVTAARSAATQLQNEYQAQLAKAAQPPVAGPVQPPPPAQPNHANSAAHTGQPQPPTHGPGTTGSSLFDLNITAATHSWKLSGDKWEKATVFMEVTEGYKHRYTGGASHTFVLGARAEEVGGVDAKVTLMGDWRQINTKNYGRNAGIKVESVLGSVDETTYASEVRQTPALRQDTNPTSYAGKGPEFQTIATQAVQEVKEKYYNKYRDVVMKANQATVHCERAFMRADTWNRKVKTCNQEIDEQTAKFSELQQQCKNFAIKSSSFVKLIASGGIKLKSGKLKGTIKSKVKAMADSMAEFKGDVKLGG